MDGHFSHPAGAGRPACAECDYYPGFLTDGQSCPCSVLHRAGFAVPPWLPLARWALTPPFHPYLCPCGPSAVCFLLHFPSGFLAVPVPRFHEARCPVVSGLSSSPARAEPAAVRGAAGRPCSLTDGNPSKRSTVGGPGRWPGPRILKTNASRPRTIVCNLLNLP